MMVLVHTTVWIDFFAARSSDHVVALKKLTKIVKTYASEVLS